MKQLSLELDAPRASRIRNEDCTRCALHETAQFVCLMTKPRECDVMVIGEAPGKREDNSGKPFVGRAGEVLSELFGEAGIDRDEVYITNAVKCRPPDNRTPKAKEIAACHPYLQAEIKVVKPKFVLLLGNIALQAVLGIKGIKKARGRPVEKDGIIYLPTFHPSFVMRGMDHGDMKARYQVLKDLRSLREMIDFGGIPEEKGLRYTVVDTWEKVGKMLAALRGVVSCDIETTCLYPWAKEAGIVTLGFGTAEGEYGIFIDHRDSEWKDADIQKIMRQIERKLEDCIVVFHGGKFDALWLLVQYGIRVSIDFDSMLAHYILDENDLHDLEHLAKQYFGAPNWDIPLEEKQGNAPIPKIGKYHGHDLFYTRGLYFKLKKELTQDRQVEKVYRKILLPCANIFAQRIEYNGVYIDVSKMGDAEKKLRKDKDEAEQRLNKWGKINWGSPQQVGKLLFDKLKIKPPMKTKKGANSTAESALKQIDHQCVGDLLKFRAAKQMLSFFIEGWKPYLILHRIHPTFKLHGTVTGRLSSEHPNFQQVPRDPLIRTLITAPDGWTFVEIDLSQIELRIVAELSQEPNMLHAFRTGVDIHWLTAMREIERGAGLKDLVISTAKTAKQLRKPPSYGEAIQILLEIGPDAAAEIDPEWKEYRKKAKAVNFGYVFGMWWKKFKIYARDNYDVHLTDAQAQASRKYFFQTYKLEPWHDKQRRFARMNGFVRSMSGRKRRLPEAQDIHDTPARAEAWRQAINSPVQSFANELNLMVLIEVCGKYSNDIVRPVMTVHDQVGLEIRNDHIATVVPDLEKIMEHPKLLDEFDIDLTVPIAGEAKIGPWGAGVSFAKWKKQNGR